MSPSHTSVGKLEPAESPGRSLLINPIRRERAYAVTLRFGERGSLENAKMLELPLHRSASPATMTLDGSGCMIPELFVPPPLCPEIYRQSIRGHRASAFTGRHLKMRV